MFEKTGQVTIKVREVRSVSDLCVVAKFDNFREKFIPKKLIISQDKNSITIPTWFAEKNYLYDTSTETR